MFPAAFLCPEMLSSTIMVLLAEEKCEACAGLPTQLSPACICTGAQKAPNASQFPQATTPSPAQTEQCPDGRTHHPLPHRGEG